MCIGIPMQVLEVSPGHARVAGRGEVRHVDTVLVGAVRPGDWLLIFLGSAREHLTPERAGEVNATLDLVAGVLRGPASVDAPDGLAFTLPSSLSAAQVATLAGALPDPV